MVDLPSFYIGQLGMSIFGSSNEVAKMDRGRSLRNSPTGLFRNRSGLGFLKTGFHVEQSERGSLHSPQTDQTQTQNQTHWREFHFSTLSFHALQSVASRKESFKKRLTDSSAFAFLSAVPKNSYAEQLALIHKWRASGNGHIRLGRGEKNRERAVKEMAQGGIYRICASELESALGLPPFELKTLRKLAASWASNKLS